MKITIRENVWETNSSSMHTIAVAKYHPEHIYPCKLTFYRKQFGWEIEEYDGVLACASYLYEAILGYYSYAEQQRWLDWIYDVLGKHSIGVEFRDQGVDHAGWIDHVNECGPFLEYVLHDEESLLSYLFGDSAIYTCNDNTYPDEREGYYQFGEYYGSKPEEFIVFEKDN